MDGTCECMWANLGLNSTSAKNIESEDKKLGVAG
jgi:hypothetical protein